jgi:hypothetical protein
MQIIGYEKPPQPAVAIQKRMDRFEVEMAFTFTISSMAWPVVKKPRFNAKREKYTFPSHYFHIAMLYLLSLIIRDSEFTDIPSFALRFRSDLLPLIEHNRRRSRATLRIL